MLGRLAALHLWAINPETHPGDAVGEPAHQPHLTLLVRGELSTRALALEHRPAGGNVALCRCGLSEVKPFCDGSHNAGGFDSAPTATEQPYPW